MGCHIGFGELLARGSIANMPRIHGVQAANCGGLHLIYQSGGTDLVGFAPKPTIADGIASQKPVRPVEVMAAVRESGGSVLAVSESEIVEALRRVLGLGMFIEPTTAAGLAGLSQLLESGAVADDEVVVVVLTGSGLKAVEKIGAALDPGSAAAP